MSPERLAEIEALPASGGFFGCAVTDLLAEVDRLRSDLDAAQLARIEAQNPGIDMDAVRAHRRAALSGEHPDPPDAYENYVDETTSAGRQVDEQPQDPEQQT